MSLIDPHCSSLCSWWALPDATQHYRPLSSGVTSLVGCCDGWGSELAWPALAKGVRSRLRSLGGWYELRADNSATITHVLTLFNRPRRFHLSRRCKHDFKDKMYAVHSVALSFPSVPISPKWFFCFLFLFCFVNDSRLFLWDQVTIWIILLDVGFTMVVPTLSMWRFFSPFFLSLNDVSDSTSDLSGKFRNTGSRLWESEQLIALFWLTTWSPPMSQLTPPLTPLPLSTYSRKLRSKCGS